jgi:hypothetical protein
MSSLLIFFSKHTGAEDLRSLPLDLFHQCILIRRKGERIQGIKEIQLKFTMIP